MTKDIKTKGKSLKVEDSIFTNTPEIDDEKLIFVVYTTTDLTEGRTPAYPMAFTESRITADRIGKGKYVQGGNCPVKEEKAYLIDGRWFIPARILAESEEDEQRRGRLEAKQNAIKKAKKAGLSEDEMLMLLE